MILHTLVPYEEAIKGDVIGITQTHLKLGHFFLDLQDHHNKQAIIEVLSNLDGQHNVNLNASGLKISIRVHPAGSTTKKKVILWAALQLRGDLVISGNNIGAHHTIALGIYSRPSFLDFFAYAGITP